MAISDSAKIDLLLKKLYGVAKTDTAANKSPTNEAISSPALIRGDTIWTQANSIPSTAAPVSGIVQGYLSTSRIQCVADTTTQLISGIYPTWKTNLTNWISPEFDTVNLTNTYRVQVYYGNAGLSNPAVSGGTQIFADGSANSGEWYFDYQSGTLNFLGGTAPAGMNNTHVIYIYGYRYIGSTTINNLVAPENSNISLTTSGTGQVILSQAVIPQISGNVTVSGNIFAENLSLTTITADELTIGNIFIGGDDNASTISSLASNTDLYLDAAGTGKVIITSNTDIVGNLDVSGNITLGGNIIIGDTTIDTVTVIADFTSDLVPNESNIYSLGTQEKAWKELVVNTIDVGNLTIDNNVIASTDSNTDIEIRPAGAGKLYANTGLLDVSGNIKADAIVDTVLDCGEY